MKTNGLKAALIATRSVLVVDVGMAVGAAVASGAGAVVGVNVGATAGVFGGVGVGVAPPQAAMIAKARPKAATAAYLRSISVSSLPARTVSSRSLLVARLYPPQSSGKFPSFLGDEHSTWRSRMLVTRAIILAAHACPRKHDGCARRVTGG